MMLSKFEWQYYVRPSTMKMIILATVICGTIGYVIYDHSSWQTAFQCGRIPRWLDIIRVFSPRWLMGWGMGLFQTFFPVLLKDPNPFPLAHNDFLQLWTETGVIGLGLFLAYFYSLIARLYKKSEVLLIAGLACIGTNMFFAFPCEMTQTVLIMICFVGYCEKQLQREVVNG